MAKHHDIAEVLRTRIADGTYALNNRLPGLELLAAEFGVSNGVIRRAEASLEQAGILRIAQGEGAFVIRVPAKVDMLAELKEMRTTINRLIEALEGSR
jgi:DNA-binding GntR family transcriptional regulator